jgi:hypothetical protein
MLIERFKRVDFLGCPFGKPAGKALSRKSDRKQDGGHKCPL